MSGLPGYHWTQKPPAGSMLDRGHPLARGVTAYWLFNEGGGNQAFDIAGRAADSVFTDNPTTHPAWAAGRRGAAFRADGFHTYADIVDRPAVRLTTAWTLEAWVRLPATGQTNCYAIAKNDTGGTNQWAIIYGFVANTYEFFAAGTGFSGSAPRSNSQIVVADTNLHHIVYASDGTTWSGYLDGVRQFNVSQAFSLGALSGLDIYLGGANALIQNPFAGEFDSLILRNRAMTPAEVAQAYAEPYAMIQAPAVWRFWSVPAGGGPVLFRRGWGTPAGSRGRPPAARGL